MLKARLPAVQHCVVLLTTNRVWSVKHNPDSEGHREEYQACLFPRRYVVFARGAFVRKIDEPCYWGSFDTRGRQLVHMRIFFRFLSSKRIRNTMFKKYQLKKTGLKREIIM